MARDETTQQIERDRRWAERWEKAHDRGRRRFIVMEGVVWGVTWAIGALAWRWWDTGVRPALPDILVTAIIAAGCGLAFAAIVWWRAERRYQQWLARHPTIVGRVFE